LISQGNFFLKIKLFFILFLLMWSCGEQEAIQPQQSYSFFVAGHTYGAPGVDNIGFHPPFKEKFYLLQNDEVRFGLLTGDIVWKGTEQNWDEIDRDIDSLGIPVYFAVGNHDITDRVLFENRYGQTYYHFTYNHDLFIVLDPNLDHWNISGAQLLFLEQTITQHKNSCKNIFVFFHQLLWWQADNRYQNVIPNSFFGRADTTNFWTEVEPLFHALTNPVVMFAGDVGADSRSADYMYHSYDHITLIASGMGEGSDDNLVIVRVHADKTIEYELIALYGDDIHGLGALTDYQLP
jgi:hypothetical protein